MQIRTILITFTILCASCSSYDFSRTVVQQGNLLPQAKIDRIHKGMSKQQVAIILGTSLISPTFNSDRWDYAYTWRKRGGNIVVRNAIVYFNNDVVSEIKYHR